MQALTKEILVEGRPVKFRASAYVLRLYRVMFKRDIMQDIMKLKSAYHNKLEKGTEFETIDLEVFENIAYTMAYHADESIGKIEEWLGSFGTFSIYEILPEVLTLWLQNEMAIAESKKKLSQVTGS